VVVAAVRSVCHNPFSALLSPIQSLDYFLAAIRDLVECLAGRRNVNALCCPLGVADFPV
jgi:hypothetical protein